MTSPELRRWIDPSPTLEREVVLFPTEPTKDDAEALAKALHADIFLVGERWRIVRRDETQDSLVKEDAKGVLALIGSLAFRADVLAGRFEKEGAEAPLKVLLSARARFKERAQLDRLDTSALQANEATPVARLLVDLLRRIPVSDLEGVKPGTLAIFSNLPAGLERPLQEGKPALERYAVAQKQFAEWSERVAADGSIPDADRWIFPRHEFQPGMRTLQLWIDRREPKPSFALEVYDPRGRLESNALLTAEGFDSTTVTPERKVDNLGKVSLPLETLAALTPATLPADPAARDPLDIYVRDLLLLWGKAKGFDRVVACVPDALLGGARDCVSLSTLDLDALTKAINRAGCESLVVGNTLVIRPSNPFQEEAFRIDRRPLSALYHVASRKTFVLKDLLAYHAAYADSYEQRPDLRLMEKPIRDAFGLKSREWSLPHSFLAIMGKLSPSQRQELAKRGIVSLSSPDFSICLFSLAQSSAASAPGSDDLGRTPSRILANVGGRWLEGSFGSAYTLVRRVSKGYAERSYGDLVTGERKVEKGNNLVLDRSFVQLQQAIAELPQGVDVRRTLNERYTFFWAQEQAIVLRIRFGEVAQVGPVFLRDRLRESKIAEPLDRVPGLEIPKPP